MTTDYDVIVIGVGRAAASGTLPTRTAGSGVQIRSVLTSAVAALAQQAPGTRAGIRGGGLRTAHRRPCLPGSGSSRRRAGFQLAVPGTETNPRHSSPVYFDRS